MVVLVTGANGQLGQSLQFIAKNHLDIKFVFCSSSDLDITIKENCQAVFAKYKPNFCINAAAYTAVDKAETETEKAYLINVEGAKNIAEACKEHNTVLLHISTDFVFDGTKTEPYTTEDATNPLGVYGKTKLQGEQAIQNTWEKHYIIRTSWVYSHFGNNFYKTMLRLAQERDEISVVNDQIGCPTNAVYLAKFLVKIVEIKPQDISFGIYHFSGDEVMSWYDFALKIFAENKITIKVNPIPTSAYPTPAKRPAYSVLNNFQRQNRLE
jgi:dTDP-4-dehydrorhamnose reductase